MYCPAHFEDTRSEVLHALMRARPLATLVTTDTDGLDANLIPLHLDTTVGTASPYGTLRGHLARANPLWQKLGAGSTALAIFHGPQGYISPNWYPTKRETGKAVPTWNYVIVQAQGRLRAIDDADWLRQQITALTAQEEAAFPHPWQVTDAPADYIEKMLGAIVGIELEITRLVGKWKISQNQPPQNRVGVVAGLHERDTSDDLAMADLIANLTEAKP
jgi:transcriptional regulator